MRLNTEFIRLPLAFDAARLASEIRALPEVAWQPHPEGHAGNAALPLMAVEGDPLNNGVKGVMQPTPQLHDCPYLQQVMSVLQAPIGRTRLMRIDGRAEASLHVDVNYYWQQHMRVHVPIVTDPAVQFICGGQALHMAAGQAWVFDTWREHNVINPTHLQRIHLVIDTTGSAALSALLAQGGRPTDPQAPAMGPVRTVAFEPGARPKIWHEVDNFPVVMSPAEQQTLFANIQAVLPSTNSGEALRAEVAGFFDQWRQLWDRHQSAPSGWRAYADLLESTGDRMGRLRSSVTLSNGVDGAFAVQQILLAPALNTDLAERVVPSVRGAQTRFDRPVFIVSSPRSGSSLLFETLSQAKDVFSIGGESHALIEGIEALHPAAHQWHSNQLGSADATPEVMQELASRFATAAHDREGRPTADRDSFRFLEKTPKNSLRIPFLRAMFPDAMFIYLYRDERATISSMLDAWRSGHFVTYDLPGWRGTPWSLALVQGWRDMAGMSTAEVAVRQWESITRTVLDDLQTLPPDSWCVASYDQLVAHPEQEVRRLSQFVGLPWDRNLTAPLPPSRHTLTPANPDKWRANATEIEPLMHLVSATAERARALFAHEPLRRPPTPVAPVAPAPMPAAGPHPATVHPMPTPAPSAAPAQPHDHQDFRSVHTTSLPQLLNELGASLLVTTYQSGRLITLRADGPKLNTHLTYFPSPMGMAYDGNRLAIGTLQAVWDYRNMPDVASRLHPNKHDGCFIPRNMHVTGDIRVHELAFDAGGELWVVNTRFSALCTLDRDHSFVPRWRPSFVTALAAEDRCHLNGLGMRDGTPTLVTALGSTNTPEGWRHHKAQGGIVMDIASNEIVTQGLGMPHSPRWHNGQWWLLESAKGTLITFDPATGKTQTVAHMPGFTRGLAMHGSLAFVGLSQVRESVFDGIALSQRLKPEERSCGVWVIDLNTGNTVGFIRFEGIVQEIFDIQILPDLRYPEVLEPDADVIGGSFVLSDEAMKDVARD
ncbi:TIGR03032 family protein [Acidovorax sp. NPDC077693]|uniref:TIGR03032 family protein n=1 Tax=unclassified Acidovorax TaxID=2684926 RepID=UPI0037C5693F